MFVCTSARSTMRGEMGAARSSDTRRDRAGQDRAQRARAKSPKSHEVSIRAQGVRTPTEPFIRSAIRLRVEGGVEKSVAGRSSKLAVRRLLGRVRNLRLAKAPSLILCASHSRPSQLHSTTASTGKGLKYVRDGSLASCAGLRRVAEAW